MADENSRNDIPLAEDARDFCNDHSVIAAWAGGAAAGAATKGAMDAAGVFSAGAGLGFAISGNLPAAAVADTLATGLLNPAAQATAVSGATKGAEQYLTQNWEPICDGVSDGINATADGALAVSQFIEHSQPPSYFDAKLGYDPAVSSPPDFQTNSSALQESTTAISNTSTPSFNWASWGLSDSNTPSSNPTLDSPTSASDTSNHGFGGVFGSLFGGGSESSATSVWGTASSGDTSASSLLGGSTDSSVPSDSMSWGSDTYSSSSGGGWGSIFGSSSSPGGFSDSGASNSSTSTTYTDWGNGSSDGASSDGGRSPSHDSSSSSSDGGI